MICVGSEGRTAGSPQGCWGGGGEGAAPQSGVHKKPARACRGRADPAARVAASPAWQRGRRQARGSQPCAAAQPHLEVQVLPQVLREEQLQVGLRLLHILAVGQAPALQAARHKSLTEGPRGKPAVGHGSTRPGKAAGRPGPPKACAGSLSPPPPPPACARRWMCVSTGKASCPNAWHMTTLQDEVGGSDHAPPVSRPWGHGPERTVDSMLGTPRQRLQPAALRTPRSPHPPTPAPRPPGCLMAHAWQRLKGF